MNELHTQFAEQLTSNWLHVGRQAGSSSVRGAREQCERWQELCDKWEAAYRRATGKMFLYRLVKFCAEADLLAATRDWAPTMYTTKECSSSQAAICVGEAG